MNLIKLKFSLYSISCGCLIWEIMKNDNKSQYEHQSYPVNYNSKLLKIYSFYQNFIKLVNMLIMRIYLEIKYLN